MKYWIIMKCYCGKTLHDCTRMLCIHILHRISFIDNFHKRVKLLNSLADVIIFSCCSISMSYRNYEALRLGNANKIYYVNWCFLTDYVILALMCKWDIDRRAFRKTNQIRIVVQINWYLTVNKPRWKKCHCRIMKQKIQNRKRICKVQYIDTQSQNDTENRFIKQRRNINLR